MTKLTKHDLLWYELPSISEYVSSGWVQSIIARYMAWKINRKYKRYEFRIKRNILFKKN